LICNVEGGLERRRWIAHSLLAATFVMGAMLIVFPPARVGFYPVCPIFKYLHIQCPGCGATRALAALLRGQLAEAMRLNALFLVLFPCALAGAAECYRRAVRAGEFRWPRMPTAAVYGVIAAAVIFMVARNLLAW
jgi:Protein of unknown function (DUF2752)